MNQKTERVIVGKQPESMVVVPFGSEFLALPPDDFKKALELGRVLMPAQMKPDSDQVNNRIVDAAGAAEITGVPESWFEERARRGDIPHLKFGKYVRFRIADVLEAASSRQQNAKHIAVSEFKKRA